MKHVLDYRGALRRHLELKTRMTTESIAVAVLGANRSQVNQVQKDLETNAQALGIKEVSDGYWELIPEPAAPGNSGQWQRMEATHPKIQASMAEARKMGEEGQALTWTKLGTRVSIATGEAIDGGKWYSSTTAKPFRADIQRAYDEGRSVYQEHRESQTVAANIELELVEMERSSGFHADAPTASIQVAVTGQLPEIPEPLDEELTFIQEIQILEEQLEEAKATIATLEAQQAASNPVDIETISQGPRQALLSLTASLEAKLAEAEDRQHKLRLEVEKLNKQIDASQVLLQALEC